MALSMLFVTLLENIDESLMTLTSSLCLYTTALSGSRPSARMSATFWTAVFELSLKESPLSL